MLNTTLPASELEVYKGSMNIDVQGWETMPRISLREAAKMANPDNTFYGTSCSCKKGCKGMKCSCRQAGKPCTTRCHASRSCSNSQDSSLASTYPPVKRFKEDDKQLPSQMLNHPLASPPSHLLQLVPASLPPLIKTPLWKATPTLLLQDPNTLAH